MKEVNLYTDGACSGNPGKGGYGVILEYMGNTKEISKGYECTTNNRMEIMAALAGLSALKEPCRVKLYSDSKYLVDAVNKDWLGSWQKNNWRNSKREPVKNKELFCKLLELMEIHEVEFIWVKGHDGHEQNERCDFLATSAVNNPDLAIDEDFMKYR